jgi:hypothetical protein
MRLPTSGLIGAAVFLIKLDLLLDFHAAHGN